MSTMVPGRAILMVYGVSVTSVIVGEKHSIEHLLLSTSYKLLLTE